MLQWLKNHLEILDKVSDIDEIEGIVPAPDEDPDDAVLFLPALSGLLAPYWYPDAKARFHSLTLNTGRREMIRAVVESIAFSCRQVIDLAGGSVESISIDGGLTKCQTLMQIQATLLGGPVRISEEPEATALGAAIAACQGYTGQAYQRQDLGHRIVDPLPGMAEYYERKYRRWLALMDASFKQNIT